MENPVGSVPPSGAENGFDSFVSEHGVKVFDTGLVFPGEVAFPVIEMGRTHRLKPA
jgi:hypothetical protein